MFSVLFIFSTTEILDNLISEADNKKGRKYFEGSLKFQATLNQILNKLIDRVKWLAQDEIASANISQIWGVGLLIFVMILSPILVILAKNAISSIQIFAGKYFFNEFLDLVYPNTYSMVIEFCIS